MSEENHDHNKSERTALQEAVESTSLELTAAQEIKETLTKEVYNDILTNAIYCIYTIYLFQVDKLSLEVKRKDKEIMKFTQDLESMQKQLDKVTTSLTESEV